MRYMIVPIPTMLAIFSAESYWIKGNGVTACVKCKPYYTKHCTDTYEPI